MVTVARDGSLRAVLLVSLFLTGCGQNKGSDVCQPIAEADRPMDGVAQIEMMQTPEYAVAVTERCLHHHAYRLAGASDDMDVIARAAITACENQVERAVSQRRSAAFEEGTGISLSERIQAGDDAEAAARKSWTEYALMRAVEGRAGDCKAEWSGF